MKKNTLTVRNLAQKTLLEEELFGQISDGMWENVGGDHWQVWCDTEVVVGTDLGRNFYAKKSNYNFTSKDLLEVVGDRMVEAVRTATGDLSYEMRHMMADLKDLKIIIRIQREATQEEKENRATSLQEDADRQQAARDRVKDTARQLRELVEELGLTRKMYVSEYGGTLTYENVMMIAAAIRSEVNA